MRNRGHRRPRPAPWLHPIVRAAVESGTRTVTRVNERGQEVHTLRDLTLEEGLYANAGMYAWAKSIAAGDLADRGAAVEDLPAHGEYFWATVYFNAGPGTGRKLLDQHGARYFERKWTGPDDPGRYHRVAQYNALWRTASFEYMFISVYGGR